MYLNEISMHVDIYVNRLRIHDSMDITIMTKILDIHSWAYVQGLPLIMHANKKSMYANMDRKSTTT